jgi:hypothetical protein
MNPVSAGWLVGDPEESAKNETKAAMEAHEQEAVLI